MTYTNLEQRMAHAYLDMFPPFVPLKDGPVSEQSQEQFYRFIKSVFQILSDSPERFFKNINEDDAYPNRYNRTPYGKPKLINIMRKDLAQIDELVAQLFRFGQSGKVEDGKLVLAADVVVKKKVVSALPLFGLALNGLVLSCDGYDNLFPAWVWMATRENADVVSFARCMFDPNYSYMRDIFGALFGDPVVFDGLEKHLSGQGYTRADHWRSPFTLDYFKTAGGRDVPLGDPCYGSNHYGIAAEYRPDIAVPQFMVLRIIRMKDALLKFDLMPETLKAFVIKQVKKCDGCGYCTQTDKTGKRKPMTLQVMHDRPYNVCPIFPGYNFTFTRLDQDLANNLAAFLDFLEGQILQQN